MVIFGDPNDRFHHIWEAAATATALLHGMIDLRRHDQLPGILVQQPDDRLLDLLLGDDIAMTNQHWLARLADGVSRAMWLDFLAEAVPEPVVRLRISLPSFDPYLNTLSGASRLSDPSKAMVLSFREPTARSIDLV